MLFRSLATREAALTGKTEALDLRKQELEREVGQRLAEMEKTNQEVLDEKIKDIRHLQLKETEAQKAIEDVRKDLLTEQESARALREQAQLDSQKVARLEESLKLREEELSSLKTRHLELEEDHSRASSELAELRRQTEGEFKGVAAARAGVAMRVQ